MTKTRDPLRKGDFRFFTVDVSAAQEFSLTPIQLMTFSLIAHAQTMGLPLEASQAYMARCIGVNRESVARALATLKRRGLIRARHMSAGVIEYSLTREARQRLNAGSLYPPTTDKKGH